MAPSAVTVTHGDGTNWTLVAILIASSPTRYVYDPREPLNKSESSAIRPLLRLSLLGFPKAVRASRGLVQRFPSSHLLLQISPQTPESMTMSSPTPPQPQPSGHRAMTS